MRALVAVSAFIVLVLLSPALPPRGERAPAPVAASGDADRPALRLASRQRPADTGAPGQALAEEAAKPTAAAPPVRRSAAARAPAPASAPADARAAASFAAVAGLQRFTPGSRQHAQALAAAIGAEDHARTMAPVARLYHAYFDRAPDYEGLTHYVDEREAGTPLAEIADEFAGSPEFEMRYGELDNAAFVDRIYRNANAAAGEGRSHWIAQLDAGAMSRGEVMLAFSEGPAFRAASDDAVFVTMAYAEALERAPTPAELARWRAFLEAGRPREDLLESLVRGRTGR